MKRHLIPVFICLTILGCADMGVEPEPAREPVESHGIPISGAIIVRFTDGTTLEQTDQLIGGLGFTFEIFTTGTPLGATVTVPVGTEDEWVVKFRTYPIVAYAGRIWLVTLTD